ncbi:MAG: polysaccharide pyruvyl transferase family protein [Amphibacillus sp.]|nr:polysaccharide pyruvyl transferase family protein [Amphibacillus sp.]
MKKVLYIGWIGYRNLGDELMFDLFKEHLSTLGEDFSVDGVNIEHRYLKNIPIENYDLIVLGGGSILGGNNHYLHPYIIDYLYKCILLNKKIMIWGSGIDWGPKALIEQLESSGNIPLALNENLKAKIKAVFEESVWTGVRGPLTLALLKAHGVDKCHISGDPGFLMNVDQLSKEDQVMINLDFTDKQEKIIGVNWGTSFNNIYGGNEEQVEDQLVDALKQLINQGYHIYLYTVWNTDLPAIERLYQKLNDHKNVTFDKTLYNHNQLLSLNTKFILTINFKLHPNYISLAANTPFIAFGYRFKIFDFAKSVDLEDFVISTDETNISQQIQSKVSNIISDKSQIKTKMNEQLNYYRDKISEPFKNNLYL